MNIKKTILLISLVFLFSTLFYFNIKIGENYYSYFTSFLYGKCHAIDLILLFPLVSIILGILNLFLDKNRVFAVINMVFSAISGFILIFLPHIICYKFSLSYKACNPTLFLYVQATLFLIYFLYLLFNYFSKETFTIRDICEIGILVALAIILDFKLFKISINVNGGSIGFAMLPLMIVSMRKGVVKGFIASGILFGFITCAIDGYGFIYFPFDYLLGFGAICALGIFRKYYFKTNFFKYILFTLSTCLIAFILRTLASTFSGMIFYHMNFLSSLIYQMGYIPLSFVACFGGLLLFYIPLKALDKKEYKYLKQY